jgi:anti-sigma factor RsiW
MDCQGYRDILCNHLEGQATPVPRADLERHVAECAKCSAFHKLAHAISCRELSEFLDDYVEDRSSAERRAIFERHLEICPECAGYLAGYRAAIAMGKAAFEAPNASASKVALEGLIRAILAARTKPR